MGTAVDGLAGKLDEQAQQILTWAIGKRFREPCEACDGAGVTGDRGAVGPKCVFCDGRGTIAGRRNFAEQIALVHSEVSELYEKIGDDNGEVAKELMKIHGKLSKILEADRSTKPSQPPVMDEHCPQFTNTEVEVADIFIRLLDMGAAYGWKVGPAMEAKLDFNDTRPPKHGKNY